MNFIKSFIFAFIAVLGLAYAEIVSTDGYAQELFAVDLIETKKYTVNGHTCFVEMIYYDGSCSGEHFNGDLIFEDSSTVVKTFKDGTVEDIARIYINGTDINNNVSRIHIEDIFIGHDENGRVISRPNIITEIDDLVWLETADVIGVAEKTGNGKRVHYLWNGSLDKPYPVVNKIPQIEAEKFTKKFLTIDVSIPGLGFDGVPALAYNSEGGPIGTKSVAVLKLGFTCSVLKLGFTCSTNTTEFRGVGADYFVDTRYNYPGQPQKISARYIIEGVDDEGKEMKIFVENKGTDDYGDNKNVQTVPFIITDNPKWAWVETAPVHGTHSEVGLHIFFWTVEGADEQQEEIPKLPTLPEVPEVPEQPTLPEVPEVPEQPVIPEIPEQPIMPEVPEQQAVSEQVAISEQQEDQVDIIGYTQELFAVDLIETKKYTVNGHTCFVEMIYYDGSCSGEHFNGDLIFEDSSTVVKTFKDGTVEDIARIYINGTDINNNVSRIHIEDIFIGHDENGRVISRPNIITEIDDLVWLETADVIGVAEKTGNGKRVHYLWNGSLDKPYPVVNKIPQIEAEKFTKKFLTIDVSIPGLGFDGVPALAYNSEGGPIGTKSVAVLKLGFTCSTNTTEFRGVGADYFVDTRYNYPGQPQKISARYIIEGVDNEGKEMKIFVENKGTDDYGDNKNVQTVPFIITDNPKWAWVETAPVHGTHSEVGLHIYFWTVVGADSN